MYLIADDEARYHLSKIFRQQFEYAPRLHNTSAGETLVLDWPKGVPESAHKLIQVLLQHPALPVSGLGNLNLALALDRYKVAEPGADQLQNTRTGAAINDLKYYRKPSPAMLSARSEFNYLANALADVVRMHPAYADAQVVTSVPGSDGSGESLGEQLGQAIARKTHKHYVRTIGPVRSARKGLNPPNVKGQFRLPHTIEGSCIAVDDVLWQGMSLNETARAARNAGATEVLGIVAAKTMRN